MKCLLPIPSPARTQVLQEKIDQKILTCHCSLYVLSICKFVSGHLCTSSINTITFGIIVQTLGSCLEVFLFRFFLIRTLFFTWERNSIQLSPKMFLLPFDMSLPTPERCRNNFRKSCIISASFR